MAKYERPSTAYTPITISANLTKYQDDRDAVPPVPISSEKVDADINKAFDHLNDLDADIIAIVAGGLPSQVGNSGKFLSSNGTSASWNFINTANLVDLSITTSKIVDNSVTLAKQAAGTSNTIQGFAGSGDPTEITTDSTLDLTSDVLSVKDVGVTLAKMANLTAGEIIVGNASNRPSAAAVGTVGQVLTSGGVGVAPTMQDASGGAWVLISSATASASTSVDFTSIIDSTYDTFVVVCEREYLSGSAYLKIECSADNGATWSPTYSFAYDANSESNLKFNDGSTANSKIGANGAPTAINSNSFVGFLTGANDSSVGTSFNYTGKFFRANHESTVGFVSNNVALTVNAIRFLPSAGTITAGKFYLYGIKKA